VDISPEDADEMLARVLVPVAISSCRRAIQQGAARPFVAVILPDDFDVGEFLGGHDFEITVKAGDLSEFPGPRTDDEAEALAGITASQFPLFIVFPDGSRIIAGVALPDQN
jgi:hypothetical protein